MRLAQSGDDNRTHTRVRRERRSLNGGGGGGVSGGCGAVELTLTSAHVATGLEQHGCFFVRADYALLYLGRGQIRQQNRVKAAVPRRVAIPGPESERHGFWYLGSRLDLVLANETLLDSRRAERAGGDVSARPEQRVSLHVRAHHALVQRLYVAVQRRAAGAHLTTGTSRRKAQRVRAAEVTREQRQQGETKSEREAKKNPEQMVENDNK